MSELGRSTQGVRIMKVEGDTEIVTLARAPREDALDEEPADNAAAAKNAKASAKEAKAEKPAKNGKGASDKDATGKQSEKADDGDQLSLL